MQMALAREHDPYSPHVETHEAVAPDETPPSEIVVEDPIVELAPPSPAPEEPLEPTPQPVREKRGRRARAKKPPTDAPVMGDLVDHTTADLEAALAALDAIQEGQ